MNIEVYYRLKCLNIKGGGYKNFLKVVIRPFIFN